MPTNDPISDPLPDEPPMIEVWVDVGECFGLAAAYCE